MPDELVEGDGYPRPQLVRRNWTDLSGPWEFADAAEVRDAPPSFDQVITVPYPPESPASGIGRTEFHPVVWYRRTLDSQDLARAGWDGDSPRALLHFGAVDWSADVWVNGTHVGSHRGGYTPFSFDITPHLTFDDQSGANVVVVRAVDDPADVSIQRGKQDWREEPHSIWYHRTSGIWQPVWLECTPELAIDRLHWRARSATDISVEVCLNHRPNGPTDLQVVLTHDGHVIATTTTDVDAREVRVSLNLRGQVNDHDHRALLWSPDSPTLIHATLLLRNGPYQDEVSSYFGVRDIRTDGRHVLLNSRPIIIRGVLAQNYWPDSHLAAPDRGALRREVELIRELGFNTARVHQKIEDPRFLYWADRLGVLVWEESPSAYSFTSEAVRATTDSWLEAINRDRSHPCIIAWVPCNESWGVPSIVTDPRQRAYNLALTQLSRAVDGDRLVISNDGWEHTDSDLLTIHDYEVDPLKLAARYADLRSILELSRDLGPAGRQLLVGASYKGQPVLLSEFGGISLRDEDSGWGYAEVEDVAELQDRVGALIAAATQSPILAGFFYTQLTDTGQETNGLLDASRNPKYDIGVIRAQVTGEAPARKARASNGTEG